MIYDIEEDRIRNKISNTCKDYGLRRIQYSSFVGDLNTNKRQEMFHRLKRTLGRKRGKILVLPVCDKDLKLMKEIITDSELENVNGD